MPTLVRVLTISLLAPLMCSQVACRTANWYQLRQSQMQSRQLYTQNKAVIAERDQATQLAQSLQAQNSQLAQQHSALKQQLQVANSRLENFASENGELKQRYVSLLDSARNQPSPLSESATRRFEDLARRYPGFEFDPETGVSKFHSDILFPSGSDQIAGQGQQLLKEFAGIMNGGEARDLHILIVGHTDDKPISKEATRKRHPTNWHLSTNRANSVALNLAKNGLTEKRMGVAGYGMHQPVVANTDDKARRQNRRVEIFVLAPEAVVAGWDPATSVN